MIEAGSFIIKVVTYLLETESFLGRVEARTVKALTPNCSILTSITFDKTHGKISPSPRVRGTVSISW